MAEKKQLQLNIAKIDGPVFAGEVESVTVPGSEGEMTILADHAPIVSVLKAGLITIRNSGSDNVEIPIISGTMELSHNSLTILL